MNYQDYIIEVKTKWVKVNDYYYRDIIHYSIDCKKDTPSYEAIKYINEIEAKKEKKNNIDNNIIEISLLDKKNNKIKNINKYMNYLLNYTKIQWETNI